MIIRLMPITGRSKIRDITPIVVADPTQLKIETHSLMVGFMHTKLVHVIVSMQEERSTPPPGPTDPNLLWMDKLDNQFLDYECLISYDIHS